VTAPPSAVPIGAPQWVRVGLARHLFVEARQDRAGHVTVVLREAQRPPLLELQPLEAQELGRALERIATSLGVRR